MMETKQTAAAPILASITLIVGFVAVSVYLILFQPWRILKPWSKLDPTKLSMLAVGMPRSDVELLLGGPPGDYGNPELRNCSGLRTCEGYFEPPGSVQKVWLDDCNHFELYFDTSGCLAGWHKRYSYTRNYEPPAWRRKVREWIKL